MGVGRKKNFGFFTDVIHRKLTFAFRGTEVFITIVESHAKSHV